MYLCILWGGGGGGGGGGVLQRHLADLESVAYGSDFLVLCNHNNVQQLIYTRYKVLNIRIKDTVYIYIL